MMLAISKKISQRLGFRKSQSTNIRASPWSQRSEHFYGPEIPRTPHHMSGSEILVPPVNALKRIDYGNE